MPVRISSGALADALAPNLAYRLGHTAGRITALVLCAVSALAINAALRRGTGGARDRARAVSSHDGVELAGWLLRPAGLAHDSGWDRTGPPPPLPPEIVAATRGRYVEAYERLVGVRLGG